MWGTRTPMTTMARLANAPSEAIRQKIIDGRALVLLKAKQKFEDLSSALRSQGCE
jgi:hypothetical protein